ncbi:putative GDSL-like lipase/acylhydrolase with Cellulose binding domain [Actinoplanes missouriensis 431]|uniref:Putative GDSL-like lipase/acylhydrolase with Cellulose binding domain n=1 Tax=Actinoplanes missouriensis (strain ATCC 14538 / DSM 43046 / CBS 188.64 / JCM 3121 / NBRC 102363 / NCIMB 12654 / NRRL B-3342 / UNCC 431) TaxID=512565 RepID=I0HBD8_ACTM4|nr:putative GDSL-like lipase/acylhydrolase with Cellulose binding domain [Actinoplanes missouriensis 431]
MNTAAGCSVSYAVSSQWPGGFGAAVTVTNLGDPITSWALTWSFTAGQTISQLWNGDVTQSGSAVTVRNAGWNGNVASGGTASFGFNGSWTGSNPVPASFSLNGVACTGGVVPSASPSVSTPPSPSPSVSTSPSPSVPVSPSPSVSVSPSQPSGDGPTKIMALGDSITGSPGCWRALLWQKLPAAEVDFVGTLPGQGCGFAYDGENEGHGGYLVTNVANQNLLPGWLSATDPDVVMMHFGTNDAWSNIPAATILAAYTKLVGQMRAANPYMKILVAQIIPLNPPTCADCGQRVVTLNAAIPAWAASLSTAASPITVVDQWTGFDTAVDTYDGVHPDDDGNAKIANRWYPAVAAAIS